MKDVLIHKEPTELYKILKFEGIVPTGGAAISVIAEGRVKVNGEIGSRKRRLIVAGDIIEVESEKLRIVLG